jgi:hypothetical protein
MPAFMRIGGVSAPVAEERDLRGQGILGEPRTVHRDQHSVDLHDAPSFVVI